MRLRLSRWQLGLLAAATFLAVAAGGAAGELMEIHHRSSKITIDGDCGDWDGPALTLELVEPALRQLRAEGYDFEVHVVGADDQFTLDTVEVQ